MLPYGCSGYDQRGSIDLSTPEATMETYYRAQKLKDAELFKKIHLDAKWFKQDEFVRLSTEIVSHKILSKQVMKKDAFSEEGDIVFLVEEGYRSSHKPGRMVFVLRKIGKDWIIVSFNADESDEEED